MTEYEWAQTRAEAITLFNESPGAQLEQDILPHFLENPERVISTIHRIAEQTDIRSPWAVVRADLTRAAQANVRATTTKARTQAIDRAKQWIDNAGVHFDRADQVEAELFGDEYGRGLIDNADQHTRDELMAYWQEQRPRGIKAERDFEAWNAQCRAYHELRLAQQAAKRKAAQPDDQQQPDPEPVTVGADPDIDF